MKGLRDYLEEDRVNPSKSGLNPTDMKNIYMVIEHPKNYQFQLTTPNYRVYDEDERTVVCRRLGPNVIFEYNLDFYDLTNELVTICDNLGFSFKTHEERQVNLMAFEIIRK